MGRCIFVLGTPTSGAEPVADVLKALGMGFLKLQDSPKLIPTSGCRELLTLPPLSRVGVSEFPLMNSAKHRSKSTTSPPLKEGACAERKATPQSTT